MPIAAGGYLLDIVGALTLASAFMFKRPSNVVDEARTYVGGNLFLGTSVAKQTADAWVGGTLLALGFLGQFIQSVGVDPNWAGLWLTIPVALGIDVAALLLLFFSLRPWNVRRLNDLIKAESDKNP
jgi:hypothetical protein